MDRSHSCFLLVVSDAHRGRREALRYCPTASSEGDHRVSLRRNEVNLRLSIAKGSPHHIDKDNGNGSDYLCLSALLSYEKAYKKPHFRG